MKKILSFLLIMTLIFSFTVQGLAKGTVTTTQTANGRTQIILEFKDAKEAEWALEYIAKMQSMTILRGYEDGTFRPNQPVNRIEAIVTAVRLMGLEDEAKEKSLDTKINFKDAKLLDQKYSWAKGYVIVALENGLFDSTEDQLQPDKPASRLWVSSLLVRALGLEKEALAAMTAELDFKDIKAIPAGSIGYVKVAVDREIVTGYPDQTFQPNKNVTRAEMAALLDRTNDNLLKDSGAYKVVGTIVNLDFDDEERVTNSVYTDGKITIKTFTGEREKFYISSDLLIQSGRHFITADQLKVDDVVSLNVKNDIVIEAVLLEQTEIDEELAGIHELSVEIEFGEKSEYKLKYTNDDGKVKAKIENRIRHRNQVESGVNDVQAAERILKQMNLQPDMTKEEVVKKVLDVLDFSADEIEKLKIKVEFSNGYKMEIELENEDLAEEEAIDIIDNGKIKQFQLKINGTEDSLWKYEYNNGNIKAEVTRGKNKERGKNAQDLMEQLLEQLDLTADMTEEEVLEAVISALDLDLDEIEEIDVEVEFANDQEIEVEFKNKDE